jgi:hypothetical protein
MAETPELAAVPGFPTAGSREIPPIKPSSQKGTFAAAKALKTTEKVEMAAAHKKTSRSAGAFREDRLFINYPTVVGP